MKVGFVGLGNMGNPIALNVLKNGFALTVFDKNPKAMQNVVDAGAKGASSAAGVMESSEVLLTCLPGSPEVEAFYLSAGGAIRERWSCAPRLSYPVWQFVKSHHSSTTSAWRLPRAASRFPCWSGNSS